MPMQPPRWSQRRSRFEHGEGVPKDPLTAVALYCVAARAGNAEAQYNLGWMFANGRGVERDDAIASSFFALAAKSGHDYAQKMLVRIGPSKGELPECMRPPERPPALAELQEPDPFVDLPPNHRKIAELVEQVAPRYGIEPRFALAVIAVESNFEPLAAIAEGCARADAADSADRCALQGAQSLQRERQRPRRPRLSALAPRLLSGTGRARRRRVQCRRSRRRSISGSAAVSRDPRLRQTRFAIVSARIASIRRGRRRAVAYFFDNSHAWGCSMDAHLKSAPSMRALIALTAAAVLCAGVVRADRFSTIDRVRASVVAIGTLERTRTPQFQFLGTGFVVGDGTIIATNAHVVPPVLDVARGENVGGHAAGPGQGSEGRGAGARWQARGGRCQCRPRADHDRRSPLPALRVRDSDSVREGQDVLFTGFPIGAVLGPYPATHGGMISVVTPIAIPQGRAADLDPRTLRRLTSGSFPVFQLDATAYPGSSGSPVYDPVTGDVIGIINMVFVKGTKEAALSQPSGITYAVPSKHLQGLIDKAR
jgi:S1-C subfamily serine protease